MTYRKLDMIDIENRIRDAYQMARYTGESPAPKIRELKTELNSRTAAGRRRYPVYMSDFTSGYDTALFRHMMERELEVIWVNETTGGAYTTDKSGRSTLERIPPARQVEVATSGQWSSAMRFIETGRLFRAARDMAKTNGEG